MSEAEELVGYIETLKEFEGSAFGWWVKGYIEKDVFIKAIGLFESTSKSSKIPCPDTFWQGYWRCVPNGKETKYVGLCFRDAVPGSRGAFPVTVCEFR